MLVPVPVVLIPPGYLCSVHVPDAGRPLSTTLPVATVQLGAVMVPTSGADGVAGWACIAALTDEADTHPA